MNTQEEDWTDEEAQCFASGIRSGFSLADSLYRKEQRRAAYFETGMLLVIVALIFALMFALASHC